MLLVALRKFPYKNCGIKPITCKTWNNCTLMRRENCGIKPITCKTWNNCTLMRRENCGIKPITCKTWNNCTLMRRDQSSDRCTWSESELFSMFFAGRTELLLGMLTNGVGLDKLLELFIAQSRHS